MRQSRRDRSRNGWLTRTERWRQAELALLKCTAGLSLSEAAGKVDGIEEAIEARGAIQFYPPAYSPDLNPIEQLFSKLKAMLRKIAAYSLKNAAFTIDSLCKAIASCLGEDSPGAECAAYLANSGYGQPSRETL